MAPGQRGIDPRSSVGLPGGRDVGVDLGGARAAGLRVDEPRDIDAVARVGDAEGPVAWRRLRQDGDAEDEPAGGVGPDARVVNDVPLLPLREVAAGAAEDDVVAGQRLAGEANGAFDASPGDEGDAAGGV